MERMIKTFIELTQILSPSQKEEKIRKYIINKLSRFTNNIIEDRYGNLIIKIPSSIRKSKPFLLSAHMDTVNTNTKPIIEIEKNKIKARNKVILGADCKAAIAIIIEVVRHIFEKKQPHSALEIVLTSGEEIGLYGSSMLDKNLLNSKYGIVLDNEKEISNVILKAPGVSHFEINIKSKSAHSGVNPDDGISAIKIIARIINEIEANVISSKTRINIGFIEGGKGINIIPDNAKIKGEIRSFDEKNTSMIIKKMKEMIEKILKDYKKSNYTPEYEFNIIKRFDSMSINKNEYIVRLLKYAYLKNNIKPYFTYSFGGTDANNFYKMGILTPNIPTGMKKPHSQEEYLDLKEFKKSFDIVIEVLKCYINE